MDALRAAAAAQEQSLNGLATQANTIQNSIKKTNTDRLINSLNVMDELEARYRKNHRDITALTGYENNPGMLYDPTDEKLATAIKNNNDYINKVYNDSINREL